MLDFKYPTPLPSTKGWGAGWPNCQSDKIVPHPIFQGGVHTELKELVDMLVAEIQEQGYRFHEGWSWGFGCRATKGGSGSVPSFHSWGLALDINAPENPFGAAPSQSDINMNNQWIVDLMREYGFFWLGPSIADWMHFSFCGSLADAKAMTIKAREDGLGMALSDEDKATIALAKKFLATLSVELGAAGGIEMGNRVGKAVKRTETGITTAHSHTGQVTVT